MTCWMGVALAEHARAGRDGGFAQLSHGKHAAVRSLRKGDWIVYYSPREKMCEGEIVQAFTTIGQIISDAPYQVEQTIGFHPFRVDVRYIADAKPASIKPLLTKLDLTRRLGANWGIVMRTAKRKLIEADISLIAVAMGVTVDIARTK